MKKSFFLSIAIFFSAIIVFFGLAGNALAACSGTITGQDGLTYGMVLAADGNCWLDRNLGATQVATSLTDTAAYGYYYQWGRGNDGHQVSTSGTTDVNSNSDTPGHGNFITEGSMPLDWREPQNDNLWKGLNGINNPCPAGFHVPTYAEWIAVVNAQGITNAVTGFNSVLKIVQAGYRNSSNMFIGLGNNAWLWSSDTDTTKAFHMNIGSAGINSTFSSYYRSLGMSVRCVKTAPDIITRNYSGSGTFEPGQTITFSAEALNQGMGMDTTNSYRLEKIGGPAVTTPWQNIITTSGNYAYITGSDGSGLTDSFEIFDITTPTNPFKVSGFDKHTHTEGGIIVSGDLEYTAHGTCDPALEIWNVANKLSPYLVGRNAGCIGGAALGIAMSYPYVYLNRFSSGGLSIYNVSNPAAPILAGSAGSSFSSGTTIGRGIASKGSYVYVVGERWNGYTGGFLETYDVSNPAVPVSVGQIISSDIFMYAKVSGNYLYLGHYSSLGVSIFDISNPASPVRVAVAIIGSQVNPDISGQYLYAGNKVFNIINPASPTPVQQRSVSDIIGISVSTNYAYGLSSGSSGSLSVYEPHTFSRICIDNPNCLTSTTGRIGGADFDAGKLGASAFKAVSASWTATAGNHTVYFCSDVKNTSGYDGVAESNENNNCSSYTFTINVPPKPDLITQNINIAGTLETGQTITFSADVKNQGVGMSTANSYGLTKIGELNLAIADMARLGNYIYAVPGVTPVVVPYAPEFIVINISNPAIPTKVADVVIPGDDWCAQIEIIENYAYLGCSGQVDNIKVYDISNPAYPVLKKMIDTVMPSNDSLKIFGNYMYLGSNNSNVSPTTLTENFEIWNITNRENPVRVALLGHYGGVPDMAVQGSYAYLSVVDSDYSKLIIYNISNPANPIKESETNITGLQLTGLNRMAVSGSYLYIGKNNQNFEIYNVSDPKNPTRTGGVNFPPNIFMGGAVLINYPYAYVSNQSGQVGFNVYNISNPANPQYVNRALGGNYTGLYDQQYLYSGGWANQIFQIFEPHVFSRICLDNPNCQTTTTGRLGGGDFDNGSLAANTSKAISAASTVSAGTHTVYFCSDIKDTNGYYGVAEENETNNCASQAFTVVQKYTLTVTKAGAGSGTVTSNPAGISCGADCSESYPSSTSVTLTATPDAGSVFSSWSGCTTSSGNTCTVSMTYSRGVTATFIAKTLNVSLSVSPSSGSSPLSSTLTATVSGTAVGTINYTFYCNRNDAGTNVTLPYDGKYDGQAPTTKSHTCVYSTSGTFYPKVIVERDVVAAATDMETATITDPSRILTVSKLGTGSGTVTSNPAGINCGADCSESYANGTLVTLTASAMEGSTFTGWSGEGCSGTGSCAVSMTQARNVTAEFNFSPNFTLNSSNAIYATLVMGRPGESNATTLTVTPLNGFSSNVSLSVQSVTPLLAAGTTYYFSDPNLSAPEYSAGSQFRVNIGSGLTSGNLYLIKILGVDGGLANTADIYLNIQVKQPGWEEF